VGCRQRSDWSRLLRVVVARADAVSGPDVDSDVSGSGVAVLVPDPRRRLPGRGAWLHRDLECLDLAVRRRAFGRALRVQGAVDVRAVREHLEQTP
jgi:predicted RNA-binding protein YlxR (DUF448 family)